MTLRWDDPDDAAVTRYQLRLLDPEEGLLPWVVQPAKVVTTTRLVLRPMTNGLKYTAWVRALNHAGNGESASLTVVSGAPLAPVELRWMTIDGSFTLLWDDPENATITGYEFHYYRGDRPSQPVWTAIEMSGASTMRHGVAGVTEVGGYTFEVRAINDAGAGASSSVSPMTPSPPAGLVAWPGDEAVSLTWDASDGAITGYEVRHGGDAAAVAAEAWLEVTVADPSAPAHAVEGLTNDETYTFQVRAVNGAGGGAPSSAAVRVGPLPVPVNLSASAGEGSMTLAWDDPGNAAIAGYQVRYGESASGLPAWSDDDDIALDGDTPRHVVQNLENGTRYTFEVRAKNPAGAGSSSGLRARPGLPPAPEDLDATVGDGVVRLEWTDADDAAITGYQIHYYRGSAPPQPVWSNIDGSHAGTTGHPVTGIADVTGYTFAVRAVNAAGDGAASSVTFEMPPPPGNLRASPGVGEVTLAWDDPHDATITGYQTHHYWESRPENPVWMVIDADDAAARRHPVQDLRNGRTYTFEVRAVNATGPGSPASVTVILPPTAPAGLEGTVGDGQVTLTWDDPGDTDITGYQTHHYRGDRPENPQWTNIDQNAAAARRYTVEPLTNGRTYTVEVRASVGDEPGPPAAVTVTLPPDAPAGLEGTVGDGQVTLTWDDPGDTDISGYQYHRYRGDRPDNPVWLDIDQNAVAARRYIVTGLTNGTVNTFEVRASVGDEPGPPAAVTVTLPPDAPAGLEASPGDRQATLTWDDPGDTDISGYQYHHYRGDRPENPEWMDIDPNDATARRHTVPGLTNGIEYTFEVRAKAGIVHGDSARAMATPGPTVTPPPTPCQTLSINEISNVTVNVNESFSRTASATGGCDAIRITVTGQPTGVTIESVNDRTKRIRSTGLSAPGTHTVTVEAEDAEQNMATRTFTITVCDRIDIDSIGDFSVQEGTEFDRTVPVSGGCGTRTSERELGPTWVEHEIDTDSNLRIHGTAPSTPGTHSVRMRVRDTGDAGNYDDEDFTITVVAPPPPKCSPFVIGELLNRKVTVDNSINLTASVTPACPAVEYSIENAPGNVTIHRNTGAITGSVGRTVGEYHVTVTAAERGNRENSDTEEFTITVVCAPFVIRTIDDMEVPEDTNIGLTASVIPACPTAEFSISGQPTGVGIVSDTGFIDGNVGPNVETYDVTVTATDGMNSENRDEEEFEIRVINPCVPFSISYENVTVAAGGAISRTPTVSGGCVPIEYTKRGNWPSWVTLDANSGLVGGTAPLSAAGESYPLEVRATDRKGNIDDGPFTVTVTCPPRSLSSIADVAASRHEAISPIQVRVSGGCPPYTYRLSPNASTAGLSVSSSGQISGTPGAIGSWQITVSVTDARSNTSTTSFWIRVAEPIIIGPIADMYGEIYASFSEGPVDVSGGVTPYRYSLSGQPSGLGVSNTGVIEGTPTASGDFDVTLTVTGEHGRTESSLFFMTISSGDFNRDGRADAEDSKLFKEKMGLRRSDAGYDRRMDMNGDGIINWADFVILGRHIERDASSGGGSGSDTSGD